LPFASRARVMTKSREAFDPEGSTSDRKTRSARGRGTAFLAVLIACVPAAKQEVSRESVRINTRVSRNASGASAIRVTQRSRDHSREYFN